MRRMKRLAGLLLFTVAATVIVAQSQSSTSPTARLLVLNKEDASLAIVDPESGATTGTVPVGQGPHELVTSADGKFAFASNYGTGPAPGHTISMIDLAAKKELRRIDVAPLSRPHGLAFAGGKLYFTAEADKKIARYDPATNTIDWQFETGQNSTHMVLPAKGEPDQAHAGRHVCVDLGSRGRGSRRPRHGHAQGDQARCAREDAGRDPNCA